MKISGSILIPALTALTLSAPSAFAASGEGSFTPISFKIPIIKISIMKSDSSDEQVLYQCAAGTIAGCMADIADASILATLSEQAAGKAIKVGTYTTVNISTCPAGTTGSDKTVVKTTGQVTIGATTYYTETAGTNGVSSSLSTPEETEIDTLGCTTISVNPTTPIVVAEGAAQTLTLTVNLSNILNTSGSTSPGMGGCKAPSGGSQRGICTNAPFMIPYVGSGTVTTEKYYIANATSSSAASALTQSNANGQVLLAVDPSGKVFYVATLPLFSNTSPAQADSTNGGNFMVYGLSRIDQNDPSKGMDFAYNSVADTVQFRVGGSLDNNGFSATAFARTTSSEGVTSPRTGGTAWYYKTFKQ